MPVMSAVVKMEPEPGLSITTVEVPQIAPTKFSQRLFEEDVFATAIGYPIVPLGRPASA